MVAIVASRVGRSVLAALYSFLAPPSAAKGSLASLLLTFA